jgi:hypothetical protein
MPAAWNGWIYHVVADPYTVPGCWPHPLSAEYMRVCKKQISIS